MVVWAIVDPGFQTFASRPLVLGQIQRRSRWKWKGLRVFSTRRREEGEGCRGLGIRGIAGLAGLYFCRELRNSDRVMVSRSDGPGRSACCVRPYSQEISRQNKACFLFLLDQSFSMEEPLGNSSNRKCDELVAAINGWLQNMAIRASGDEGIKDWMDVGVFGYRTDQSANPIIESALLGPLAGRMLVSITEIGAAPARIDTRIQYLPDEETGEMIQVPCEVPVWVDPRAEGGTPMCHMLYHAHQILAEWIGQHPRSFPPIVVHITDGESQDGNPIPYAEALKALATEDGNVLLFNCHLSMTAADPFMFPATDEGLPDELARVLFHMSSVLPEPFYRHAVMEGFPLQPNARGMAFNADMVCLIQFLNMGTQAAPGLR